MSTDTTIVLWHRGLNEVHQQVALASFLRSVHRDGLEVRYSGSDPLAPLCVAVAGLVNISMDTLTPSLSELPISPWAWVGSHATEVEPSCLDLVRWPMPPRAILCFGRPLQTAHLGAVPWGHRLYVTGMNFGMH